MADVPLMNNPMTTAGDVIYGGASGAPTRLAVGTAGQVLKVNAGATAPEWGAATALTLDSDKVTRTNGTNLTISSSTWADMDSTNLTIDLTTGARRVMLVLTCSINGSNAAAVIGLNFSVDGTAVVTEAAGSKGLWSEQCGTAMTGVTLVYITDVLSAASHTFRPRWNQRAGGGHTLTAFMDVAEEAIVFSAVELP